MITDFDFFTPLLLVFIGGLLIGFGTGLFIGTSHRRKPRDTWKRVATPLPPNPYRRH